MHIWRFIANDEIVWIFGLFHIKAVFPIIFLYLLEIVNKTPLYH